jgi:NTE family protein
LVTVSVSDWKPIEVFVKDIEKGKIADYLLASSFLPGFKPQEIDGKRFLDGGFYDSLPINLIASKGYSEIVAVELNTIGRIQSVKNKSINIRRISPSGDLGSLLEFDKSLSRRNIKMGYLDTMKSYGKFDGVTYFLSNVPDEGKFYRDFLKISDEQIMTMAHIIGYKKGNPRRLLSEVIVSELCEMLDLSLEMGYKDIMIGVLEFLATALNVERLKAYSFEAFYELILMKSKKAPQKILEIESMPSILRRQTLIQKTFKVELLMKWLQMIADV